MCPLDEKRNSLNSEFLCFSCPRSFSDFVDPREDGGDVSKGVKSLRSDVLVSCVIVTGSTDFVVLFSEFSVSSNSFFPQQDEASSEPCRKALVLWRGCRELFTDAIKVCHLDTVCFASEVWHGQPVDGDNNPQ